MARRVLIDQTQYFSEFDEDGYIIPDPIKNSVSSKTIQPYEFTIYKVLREDLFDITRISMRVYGTEKLWWFILQVNDIVDPFNDLKVGTELKVLALEDVYKILQSLNLRSDIEAERS